MRSALFTAAAVVLAGPAFALAWLVGQFVPHQTPGYQLFLAALSLLAGLGDVAWRRRNVNEIEPPTNLLFRPSAGGAIFFVPLWVWSLVAAGVLARGAWLLRS